MPDINRVYLGVFDFGTDPRVVTEEIGISPTQSYTKGEKYSLSNGEVARRLHSAWRLESPLPRTVYVDEQIEALLDLIEPYGEGIRKVAEAYETGICCAIRYEDFSPGIHLSSTVVQRIAGLGLSVDFDLYFMCSSDGS